MYREKWTQHTNEADIVKDAGLAYRENDDGRDRDIICPVCRDYGRGNVVDTFFYGNQRLKNLRKGILKHLATDAHKKALTEHEKERTRQLRRSRVGLTIARATQQTVREGNSYL